MIETNKDVQLQMINTIDAVGGITAVRAKLEHFKLVCDKDEFDSFNNLNNYFNMIYAGPVAVINDAIVYKDEIVNTLNILEKYINEIGCQVLVGIRNSVQIKVNAASAKAV